MMQTDDASRLLHQERDRLTKIRNRIEWDRWAVAFDDDVIGADEARRLADDEERATVLAEIVADLAEVGRAYERLRRGTFGTCEVCGEPIDQARLETVPAARCCLLDENRLEHGTVVRS